MLPNSDTQGCTAYDRPFFIFIFFIYSTSVEILKDDSSRTTQSHSYAKGPGFASLFGDHNIVTMVLYNLPQFL
jgi:hypothetical protein